MTNDNTEYKDIGRNSDDLNSAEPNYKLDSELIKVLDELEELFPDEVRRIKEHGLDEYKEGEFQFVLQGWADYVYQYRISVNVYYKGKLIIPDMLFTYSEITNAKGQYKVLIDMLHASVPKTSMKDIQEIVANFAITIRTNNYHRETAKRWEHISAYRFKDRKNLNRFNNIADAIRCGNDPFRNEEGKISTTEVAYYLIEKYHLKVIELKKEKRKDKFIYQYNSQKGVYETNGTSECAAEIDSIFGDDSGEGLRYEIIEKIKNKRNLWMSPDDFKPNRKDDEYLINCKNGLVDVRTGNLMPHTPEYLSLIQYPVTYNSNTKAPKYTKFISEVLPNEADRRVVMEFFGYTLLPYLYNRYHKSLMLLGKPGTGKGTLLDTLHYLLGENNVSDVLLQKIESDKFMAYQLYRMVANISDDLPKESMTDCANFRSITTGARINVQNKGEPAFNTRLYVKLISSTNHLPYAPTENNDAYFRRFIIVRMDQIFSGTKKENTNLIRELTTPEELSGILNIFIENLQTLLKNNKFSYAKSLEDVKRLYELEQNHVIAFFRECTEESDDIDTVKSVMYEVYEIWCHINGIENPETKTGFSTKVKNSHTISIMQGQSKKADTRDKAAWLNTIIKPSWLAKIGAKQDNTQAQQYNPMVKLVEMSEKVQHDEPLHDYN
jgi:P4 family phage/plasmid primase-like protien